MNSLQCVGTSSKVPSKDADVGKPGILSSRDTPANKSVPSKSHLQKPKLGTRSEGKQPSVITERRRDAGNVDRVPLDPKLVSVLENSFKKININHTPSRSETRAGLQAVAAADTTPHGQERSPRHYALAGAVSSSQGISQLAEEKTGSSECAQKTHNSGVRVPRNLPVPMCGTAQSPSEAKSNDDEEDDGAEFRAPIELLAEFLKAVMEKKYTLSLKLCQMILIYEPDNPEAKSFLPLIEERLLIEEAQEGTSNDDNTSDDDDDDDEESSSESDNDDDDDAENDDDDTDTGTDSDGENICSSSDIEADSQR